MDNNKIKIVIIDDNPDDALLITLMLKKGGFNTDPLVIDTPHALPQLLNQHQISLVISDYNLLGHNALDGLKYLAEHGGEIPFILISGAIGESVAVEAMRAGATDYIMKDNMTRLCPAIERELREAEIRRQKNKAEHDLQQSIKRQQLMFEKHASAMLVINADTLIIEDANPAAQTLFGMELAGKLKGANITQIHQEPEENVVLAYNQAKHKVLNFFTWHYEDATLVTRVIEEYVTPIEIDGQVILLSILQDITQRVRTEQNLEKANKKVEIRSSELDSFVYRVSHNLRAPLCSILGLINVAHLENQSETTKAYLNKIENRINQLDNYILNVLSFSKNLNMPVNKDKLDITAWFQELENEMQYLFDEKGVGLNSHLLVKEINTDAWRFTEIVRGLLSNAIKFYDGAKANPHVNLQLEQVKNELHLTVADNGIGIPEGIAHRVTEMFFRGHTHIEGAGLGLYIINQAVEQLGGQLTLNSQHGKGTQVTVVLPL